MGESFNSPTYKARKLMENQKKLAHLTDEEKELTSINYEKHKEVTSQINELIGIEVKNDIIIINTPIINPMMKIGNDDKLMIKPESQIAVELNEYRKQAHKVLALDKNLTKNFGINVGDYVYLKPSENGFDLKIEGIPFMGVEWYKVAFYVTSKNKEIIGRYLKEKIDTFNDKIQREGAQVLQSEQ